MPPLELLELEELLDELLLELEELLLELPAVQVWYVYEPESTAVEVLQVRVSLVQVGVPGFDR